VDRCGLLLHMSHVPWPVCVLVTRSRRRVLQKQLNRLRCHFEEGILTFAKYGGAPWRWRHLTNTVNDPCAMAMRPYVKLLWSLVTERPDGLITPQTWHRIQLCNFTTFGVNDIWNKNYYHWYLRPEAIYMVSSWVHLNFSRQLAAWQPCKSNTTFTPAPLLNAPRRAAPCVF